VTGLPHAALYVGRVEHRRLTPVAHALGYDVFALLADIDALAEMAANLRFFGLNRFNLFSLYERDHGARDGRALGLYIRDLLKDRPEAHDVARIFLLAYPRVLGFVFNPISTYYAYDAAGRLKIMIYEVTNTFGDRTTYVIPVEKDAQSIDQSCSKQMWVSPFNKVEGEYGFHGNCPAETLSLGVSLKDSDGPKLKAWFRASRVPLRDGELLRLFARMPFLTFKVVLGIHWEALKLWLKGLSYVRRPEPPKPVFHVPNSKES
jgi:uncharacterized protein